MVIFHNSCRKNYAKEAVLLLNQYQYVLSPEQITDLLYGRFINTRGIPGSNISADLYMEHLNRELKGCIGNLGSNKTEESIVRLGKAIGMIEPIMHQFDKVNDVMHHSSIHKAAKMRRDMLQVIAKLKRARMFTEIDGRKFNCFPNPQSLLQKKTEKELLQWMQKHIK